MRTGIALRELALLGVALLAAVTAIGVVRAAEDPDRPQPIAGRWNDALAAPYRFPPGLTRTACGYKADADTLGVAHPVLPCGAKILLEYRGATILTQVIDRGTGAPGREFDITQALARRVGLTGVERIRWRFAPRVD